MKKFLLVVDMLNDFIDPKGALFCGNTALSIVNPIKAMVEEARKRGDSIYFLCDNHNETDKEFQRFPKHAIKGSWGQAIIPGLVNIAGGDKIISKTRYSGFYETNLEKTLLYAGYLPSNSDAVIVGCCTSICVLFTASDLINRDYNVIIPRNCVADFDQDAHEFSLKHMKNVLGIDII